jgi:hypothetical protein
MPRPAIGIGIRIGCLGERPMGITPLGGGCCPVHRGADQWVPEADARPDLDELGVLGRRERAPVDLERLRRAPDERRVTQGLGRGQQQQPLCRLRQLSGALVVLLLELARKHCRGQQLEAARQLSCAHAPWQVEQGERIAAGFRNDAVAHALVDPARDGAHEQRARILLRQPA